jgi:hypothetical protein
MIPDLFWIPGPWRGRLAISGRPRGGDRLDDEIRGWRSAQVDSVVSLLEKSEEIQLELAQEGQTANANGIRFVSFPIADRGVPTSVRSAVQLLRSVNHALEQGENIAVHCRQGMPRRVSCRWCVDGIREVSGSCVGNDPLGARPERP